VLDGIEAIEGEGDGLPAALCRAAADVIVDKGLGSFSLREVARRAGVSHAAPGYHFGDMRGLLTALATQGLRALHRDMAAAAAAEDDPAARLTAIGRAYVRVALAYPAHCEVIWREDVIDPADARYQEAGMAAYGVLEDTIRAIAAEHNPELAVEDAARLSWSAMQGLVELRPKLARIDELGGGPAVPVDELVARFTTILVDGMAARQPPATQRS
jgi:AcrR family transcriptional regulator